MTYDPTHEPTEFDRFITKLGRVYRDYVRTGITREEDWQRALERADMEWHDEHKVCGECQ